MNQGFIIRRQNPARLILILLLLILIVLVVAYAAYHTGFDKGMSEATGNIFQHDILQTRITSLEAENEQLREKIVLQKRGAQVERKAYDEVEKTLKSLQDERLELREDLALYSSILTDENLSGVRIHDLKIAEKLSGELIYELVLTRDMKNGKVLKGKIELAIEGVSGDGGVVNLLLGDVSDKKSLILKIKHLQRLQGTMVFPLKFTAKKVIVKIIPAGKSAKKVTKSFDWSTLTG